MAYYYATPKQRGASMSIYSKAKKISDIGPALARTKSAFPDSLKNGDMIRVCKKTKRHGATEMELHANYEFQDGKLIKLDDFMSQMFGDMF
ncbi:MAG: hypothetical protein VXW88_00895 [Pseudomonadota bacterium]|nr:hypothetical protein [Pseudomonadota bacterium]